MGLRNDKRALLVDKVAGADPTRYRTVDAIPLPFEVRLNLLQTVKRAHFLRPRLLRSG